MLSRLPADIVFQDWRYSYAPDMVYETLPLFRRHGLRFHAAGCGRGMSDSEWHYEYERIFGNLRHLSLQGKAAGAEGFFSTSWSTNGVMDFLRTREGEVVAGYYRLHRYPIPGNILPVLACAEHAWNAGACDTETLLRRVPLLLFGLDQPRIIEGIMDGKYEVFFLGHCRENARRCRRGYETLRSLEPMIRRNQETYRHLVFMTGGHAHMALRKAMFHEADAVWGNDADAFRALEPELRELFEQRDTLQRRHRELFAPLFDRDELHAEHAALFSFEQEAQRRYERPF